MLELISERVTAKIDGDFVIFVIGLRINKPWKIHKWLPLTKTMPRMIKDLEAQPELGLLAHIPGFKASIQYWRSFEHLEAYAQSKDAEHLPVWKAFNKSIGQSRGDIGIWHETYLVRAGEYECIYSGMPRMGLALAGELIPATGTKENARGRIKTALKSD